MSEYAFNTVVVQIGSLSEAETFLLFHRLWEELTPEQQDAFREAIEEEV